MSVSIVEYLGVNIETTDTNITPARPGSQCRFYGGECHKVNAGNKPVCSVRKSSGEFYIVCSKRLCATNQNLVLTDHQTKILRKIAKTIFRENIRDNEIAVRTEMKIPVDDRKNYKADYVMLDLNDTSPNRVKKVVLEMQGGGETSQTGNITRYIQEWEESSPRDNSMLKDVISGVGTIETNAWRRQQEQFLVKGNVAVEAGASLVFCVGKTLFDYIIRKVNRDEMRDLRNMNWTLAMIPFIESTQVSDYVELEIDHDNVLFTNYNTFVQQLVNQGNPDPAMFRGDYKKLDGSNFVLE
jgi:hypothetical protein